MNVGNSLLDDVALTFLISDVWKSMMLNVK